MKRFISAFLAVIMVLSVCNFNVFAAEKPTFTVSSASGNRGETVELTVSVENLSTSALSFQVAFDTAKLTATGGTVLQQIGVMYSVNGTENANKRGAYQFDMFAMDDVAYTDGDLVKLTFEIKDTASFGDIEMTLSNIVLQVNNEELTKDDYVVNSGKLTVNRTETVYHTWTVAGDLLDAVKAANGDAAALKFGAISYTPNHYGGTSIGSVSYSESSYSNINTGGSTQVWRAQLQIPNNQGTGAGYNNCGVLVRNVRPADTQKLTFTAPVHGIYNFVPVSVGGTNSIEESVSLSSGSMVVEVLVNGESKGSVTVDSDDTTADIGTKANLPELKGVELEKGETIVLNFNPVTERDVSNAANAVFVNFKVQITDEIAPQVLITELETATFNVANQLQLENTTAAVPAADGMFAVGYASATGTTGAGLLFEKAACYNATNGYTMYYGMYGNDANYMLAADADVDTITIASKYSSVHGVVITADKKGTYTLSAASTAKGGAGAMNLVVEDNAGNILYSSGASDADGFSFTVEMDAGDKLYIYGDRTQTNWQTSSFVITGLTLDVTYVPTRYVEPVYNVNEYVVADELLNNTGTWGTSYQDPATFTYDGFLKPVAVATDGLVMTDAWNRNYDGYDCFSNAYQTYNNHSLNAYTNGSMQWIYSYGEYRMGFEFTAPANAEYVLVSDVFVGTGINAYVYSVAEDGTLTQVGEAVAVSDTEGLNIAVDAKENVTYVITLGKESAGWNDGKDCTTSFMTLTSTELIKEGYIEELPLEYGDDPNYEYVYEKKDEEEDTSDKNLAPELAAAAEYALVDGTLSVTFPEAPADNTLTYNWSVWVEQNGLWVKMSTADGLTYSVSGVTSEDGVYNTYILCTDENGASLLEDYDNYVDSVTAETVGNAVITAVSVNGNAVADRKVYVDLTDGVVVSATAVNATSFTYTMNGITEEMVDGTVSLDITEAGTYVVTVNAVAAEGKEGDSKTIEIVAYSSDAEDVTSIDNVNATVTDNTVTVEAETETATIFDYYLKPDVTGTAIYRKNSGNLSEVFDLTGQYGYYFTTVHAKNASGSIDDAVVKNINLARPGGTWSMVATANGEAVKKNATVGETIEIAANASFPGIEDVEYMAYKKDANGTTVIKGWAAHNKVNFTPAYAGHYEVTIAARAKGNAAYEVYRTFYIEVDAEEKLTGTVSVSATNVAKNTPVTFTASTTADEAVLYRFTIMSSANAQIIQTYSPSNTCTWLPTKAGTYKIKVEAIGENNFGMYDIRNNIEFNVQ